MERIRNTFPKLFDNSRPKANSFRTSKEYKEFAKSYGLYHSIQSSADFDLTKVRKILKEYLINFFEYLTYMQDKAIADEIQNKFEDKLRKQKIK